MNNSQQWPESESEIADETNHPEPQWIFEKDLVEHVHRPEPQPPRRQDDRIKAEPRRLPIAPRHFEFGNKLDSRAANRPVETPPANPKLLRKTYVVAAFAAILAGGSAGFLGSQAGPMLKAMTTASAATPVSQVAPQLVEATVAQAASASETVITKKTIPIATLNVTDAVGEANSQIPLALSAEPAFEGQDLILKISGVPESAYLTAGTKAADNTWELSHEKLASVSLVTTSTEDRSFDLTVAGFVPATGELVTPIKEFKVQIGDGTPMIQPAAAPPDTALLKRASTAPMARAAEVPEAQTSMVTALAMPQPTARLIKEGDVRLAKGEVADARKVYEQAFSLGAVAGAMGMARNYDPAVISALGSSDAEADQVQALDWYRKALAAGDLSAEAAIKRLKSGG